jgi:hypothetical protein
VIPETPGELDKLAYADRTALSSAPIWGKAKQGSATPKFGSLRAPTPSEMAAMSPDERAEEAAGLKAGSLLRSKARQP